MATSFDQSDNATDSCLMLKQLETNIHQVIAEISPKICKKGNQKLTKKIRMLQPTWRRSFKWQGLNFIEIQLLCVLCYLIVPCYTLNPVHTISIIEYKQHK